MDVRGAVDLGHMANARVAPALIHRWSLNGLCEHFLRVRVDKAVRLSNWEARPLLAQQIHYAATDAHAGLLLYKQLAGLPIQVRLSRPDMSSPASLRLCDCD